MALIPRSFLEQVATEYGVSDNELDVLSKALLEGESIAVIAQKFNLKPETVRKRLGETYRKFQITGKGPGKMAKLQQLLVSLYQQQPQSRSPQIVEPQISDSPTQQDWDAAPEVTTFYGRTQELTQLQQWILTDRCRLVALLGMGGMGKTTLAVQFAQQSANPFDFVIWRSLRQAIPLRSLLVDFLQFLSPQTVIDFEDIRTGMSQLIELLRSHRCLLILDDVEMILSPHHLAGYYGEGFEEYGQFIQRIAEESHQSCLLLASAEKLKDLAKLEGAKVHALQILGSEEISHQILEDRGFTVGKDWLSLIERYGYNPLAVKIVSALVQDLYEGQVGDLIKNTLLMGDIRAVLDQPFGRLSVSEKELIYWLALEQQPLQLSQLQAKMLFPLSASDLLETMGSLGRRSLIEKHQKDNQTYFSLQPVVMKYIIEQFLQQVYEELVSLIKHQDLEVIQLLKLYPLEASKDSQKYYSTLDLVMNRLQSKLFTNPRGLDLAIQRLENSISTIEAAVFEEGYIIQNLQNIIQSLK